MSVFYQLRTGEKLPLLKDWSFKYGDWSYKINKKKLKTFNQKIQWIKLYGVTDLMRDCTDKVKVRDYVCEKIGAEYLKPGVRSNNLNFSLSTLNSPLFDKIDFDKLPESFVIKCNHGCKWHYIIKNKEEYLKNKRLVDITRRNITGWLEQDFWIWGGFELQYKGIKSGIIVEPLIRKKINEMYDEISVFCFSGIAVFCERRWGSLENIVSLYDKKIKIFNDSLSFKDKNFDIAADDVVHRAYELSEKLAGKFIFVRVDWIIEQEKLLFQELTFTPFSGFWKELNPKLNNFFGELIDIERI